MAKKKTEKVKGKPKSKREEGPEKQSEKILDFGGLPQRDFKKNLGCG